MATDGFEKTSWGWQISQLQQQIGEWLEYQFDRFQNSLPNLSPGWNISPWLGNLLNFLFWLIVALLFALIVWRLWREFSPYVYAWLSRDNTWNTADQNRANDLSVARWLERSQELYRQGNYREACRCLYLAILQHLHDTKLVPHKFSRTDGEYLKLLRSTVTPVQPYETLITIHEQLCFSNVEILPENYQQCQQAYQEIVNEQPNSALSS